MPDHNELAPLDAWCNGLIARLDSASRRALARELSRRLRESQSNRIAAQLNPDGSAFEPRKSQPQTQSRNKKGAIRRKMFARIRTAKWMKTEASPESAVVTFAGQVQRMAREHQFGLRARVNRDRGPEVQYPERRLLGFTAPEVEMIADVVFDHVAGKSS